MAEPIGEGDAAAKAADRRSFLRTASTGAMLGGLAAGYGTFAAYAGQFLYPSADHSQAWQFVAVASELKAGESLPFTTPSGSKVVIARQGEGNTAEDFIALSSVCPHLGCQVHWEAVQDRFFCPCHNGAFDRQGVATEGPPAAAKQQLTRFPLRVEEGLLYLLAPLESVVQAPERGRIA